MNDRKQHVIQMAHQLFIDKGFQATSIQDILDYSGISKGTFYNYFSSKNELLIALFKSLFVRLEKDRNELLIGQDPSNIDIFIKQIDLQMKMNRTNKLMTLFEEVIYSNDEELNQFIKNGHLRMIRWVYGRFNDIFGEDKKPYLLDCAIMFTAILNHNLKYYAYSHTPDPNFHSVIQYSVARIAKIVEEVSESGHQLFKPEILDTWLPACKKASQAYQQKLYHSILAFKKALNQHKDPQKYTELLDFIQDELIHSKEPRRFLIESALLSLKTDEVCSEKKELHKLEQLIEQYFTHLNEF